MQGSVETVLFGKKATLKAIPDDCCYFDHWEKKGNPCVVVSRENPYTFEVVDDVEYVAVFHKRKHSVHITSDLPDYVCVYGEGEYKCGDIVTITATANQCLSIRWEDERMNLEGESETKNGKTTIKYVIDGIYDDFYAHVNLAGGTCTLTVSSCDSASGNAFFFYSDDYSRYNTLPDGCHTFDNISSDFDICNFIESDCIIGSNANLMCGDIVTLVAEPNEGCRFMGWKKGDCNSCYFGATISESPVYTFVVNCDENYVACFECNNETSCVPIRYKKCALYEIEYDGVKKYVFGAKHGSYPNLYELQVPKESKVTVYYWENYQPNITKHSVSINGNFVGYTETYLTNVAWSIGGEEFVGECDYSSECGDYSLNLLETGDMSQPFVIYKFVINAVTTNELNIDTIPTNMQVTQWNYDMPKGGIWNDNIYEYAGLYANCKPNIFGCQKNQE